MVMLAKLVVYARDIDWRMKYIRYEWYFCSSMELGFLIDCNNYYKFK